MLFILCGAGEGATGPSGGSTLVSKYAYGNDGLARRTYAIRSGLAFAATHQDAWGYNDRNELTTTRRYNDPNVGGTTNADPNLNRDYQYDAIGNRTSSAEGTSGAWSYTRNSVNQYPAVDTPELGARYLFDPDGNLSELLASADVNLDGNIDQDDVDMVLFCYGKNVDDPNCGMSPEERQRADISGNGTIDQDDLDAVLFYFGATVSDTLNALLAWDGENRLVQWTPRSPKNGSKKCEFKYDYMGRRVEKKVYTYSGSSWSLTTTRRFIWRDWLRLMELDGSGNVLRRWTWGRDLSGTLEGAGGIGGLLSVHDANETPSDPNDDFKYSYFYDVNGNVGQVVDLAVGDPNNTIKAKYEYDAYGNVTSSGGSFAAANVVRFSTKPWDDETGMGDWGRRCYDPRLGRWVSRDPIREPGAHLYPYVVNIPTVAVDPHGLHSFASPGGQEGCIGDADKRTRADMAENFRLTGLDPNSNGFKIWHCLNACYSFRLCAELLPPPGVEDPNTASTLQLIIRLGGIVYEIGTACGGSNPPARPFDDQPFWDWLFDTPGDLVANELGLYIGRFQPGLPCAIGCLAAFKIPGPSDVGGNQ